MDVSLAAEGKHLQAHKVQSKSTFLFILFHFNSFGAKRLLCQYIWASEQKVEWSGWSVRIADTPQDVTTIRAPAVLNILSVPFDGFPFVCGRIL